MWVIHTPMKVCLQILPEIYQIIKIQNFKISRNVKLQEVYMMMITNIPPLLFVDQIAIGYSVLCERDQLLGYWDIHGKTSCPNLPSAQCFVQTPFDFPASTISKTLHEKESHPHLFCLCNGIFQIVSLRHLDQVQSVWGLQWSSWNYWAPPPQPSLGPLRFLHNWIAQFIALQPKSILPFSPPFSNTLIFCPQLIGPIQDNNLPLLRCHFSVWAFFEKTFHIPFVFFLKFIVISPVFLPPLLLNLIKSNPGSGPDHLHPGDQGPTNLHLPKIGPHSPTKFGLPSKSRPFEYEKRVQPSWQIHIIIVLHAIEHK